MMDDAAAWEFYNNPANREPAGPAKRRRPVLVTDITVSHSVVPALTASSLPYQRTRVYQDDEGRTVFRQISGDVVTITRYPS